MPQLSKPLLVKGLHEDICKMILGPDIRELNVTTVYMLSNEVVKNLNILCLRVLHWVVGYPDGTLTV